MENLYVGLTTNQLLKNMQEMLAEGGETPTQFKDRIIFHVNVQRRELVAESK